MFWYDKPVYKTVKTKIKNDFGQVIEGYTKADDFFLADIQPVQEGNERYIWGNDIHAEKEMYSDELLCVNEILVNDDRIYKILDRKIWDNYNIYALKETEVNIL